MTQLISLHPLVQVTEHIKEHVSQAPVAVVFDLDSTLFDVSPRTQAILRELGASPDFQSRFETIATILRDVEVLPTDWGIREALERRSIRLSTDQSTQAAIREIRRHWKAHFFSSRFLHHDLIYPAANEYVNHLKSLGAEVLYLTGRSEELMKSGTVEALNRYQFPLTKSQNLIMKPSLVEADETFKAHVLKELAQQFSQIWFFENEPVIIDHVRKLAPMVHILFMNSTHSRRASRPEDLQQINMTYEPGLQTWPRPNLTKRLSKNE